MKTTVEKATRMLVSVTNGTDNEQPHRHIPKVMTDTWSKVVYFLHFHILFPFPFSIPISISIVISFASDRPRLQLRHSDLLGIPASTN